MQDFWNERYGAEEYIYGTDANVFFAEQLAKLKPGKIILPCEGEGRNAVHALLCGWEVFAFDSSTAGQIKAKKLAKQKNVSLNYEVQDATTTQFPINSVDVVAFIYSHFPPEIRTQIHHKAISWLKPGGKIILEAFNPNQLKNSSGGPKDSSMLYTKEMLQEDFKELDNVVLETCNTILHEGKYHEGMADVIRFVGSKK